MDKSFYFEFEKKFRGSSSLLSKRFKAYSPILNSLVSTKENVRGIDLGCGSGEWLSYLKDLGIEASGVDLDEGMIAESKRKKLVVETNDVLSFLNSQSNSSVDIVTGFHIIEHVQFEYLDQVLKQIKRVLRPGGVLIFETPNPENLRVASWAFHLDPTHNKPIPPGLLAFLIEFNGYVNVKVLRLNSDVDLEMNFRLGSLFTWYLGSYLDYSILAQLPCDTDSKPVNHFCEISFPEEASVTFINELCKFDARINNIEAKLSELEEKKQRFKKSFLGRIYLFFVRH